jgi:hypothetical protein
MEINGRPDWRQIPSFAPDPAVRPGEFRMQQEDVNRS